MPKRSRLSGAELRSIKGARRIHGVLFSVAISPAAGHPKASITVSKKVSPKAVERNLIKRRARAVLAPLMRTLPGGAYVFSARPSALGATASAVREDLQLLARKIA